MCVMFLSSRLHVTDCEKKYEIQTALFSKQSGLPSWKHAGRYISKCLLPDEENPAGNPVCTES